MTFYIADMGVDQNIVTTVMLVAAAIFLIGGCCFTENKRVAPITIGAIIIMVAALAGLGIIERKEGVTFFKDPNDSILDHL